MVVLARFLLVAVIIFAVPRLSAAESDVTLFRLFLADGSVVVSYGEYARVEGQVIFSMPAGGTSEQPRLHVVSLPVAFIDWPRTEQYAAAARYQRYAETLGEQDFQLLSNQVARVLNDIALSTDRPRALTIAQEARRTLADWPRAHYGYRQKDVREIVGLLDEAIAGLTAASGARSFEFSLVADESPAAPPTQPIFGMPAPREQLDQLLRVAAMTTRATERVALLQSALALLNDPASGIAAIEAGRLRQVAEEQVRQEAEIDRRYEQLSQRLTSDASRAASRARVADVQRALSRVAIEDERLGRKRSDAVQALRAQIEAQLEAARQLRLRQDQWTVRRSIYRQYERSIASQMLQLVSVQPSLEAIRRLEGPAPDRLALVRSKLSGGAERLQRLTTPEMLRSVHDLIVSAWRFAEQAANARFAAISSGNVITAWEASSAAAGALMMLSRAQQEIRSLAERPQLR
jgi:hypothetical protein